jgi:hypothetical protein
VTKPTDIPFPNFCCGHKQQKRGRLRKAVSLIARAKKRKKAYRPRGCKGNPVLSATCPANAAGATPRLTVPL